MAGSFKGAVQQMLFDRLSRESAYQREEFSEQKTNGADHETDERPDKVKDAE